MKDTITFDELRAICNLLAQYDFYLVKISDKDDVYFGDMKGHFTMVVRHSDLTEDTLKEERERIDGREL